MLCLPMCVYCIQEEDEVPDDETVNQMIARSEEEFDQFMVNFFVSFKTRYYTEELSPRSTSSLKLNQT